MKICEARLQDETAMLEALNSVQVGIHTNELIGLIENEDTVRCST